MSIDHLNQLEKVCKQETSNANISIKIRSFMVTHCLNFLITSLDYILRVKQHQTKHYIILSTVFKCLGGFAWE